MHSQQHTPSKLLTLVLAGVASMGFATVASAAGGALGVNTDVGAGAQVAPAPATSMGGAAEARMGASAGLNSNAQWKDTASQGVERAQEKAGTAQDRASTQANEMRTQAQSQAEITRSQAQSQAEQMKTQAQQMSPGVRAESGMSAGKSRR